MYHYNQKLESFDSLAEISVSSKPINLKLVFSNNVVISPVFTKQNITGSCGNDSIEVMLIDAKSTERVITGPVAFAKVKIVLLDGKYDGITTKDGEFEKNIVINCGKKKNLLQGNFYVNLKHGSGTVGQIRIKHDSNPIKNVEFRLGAMVVDCLYEVKPAITQPFIVKDRRNLPKSLRSLSPTDNVWQLKNIGKRGAICKRLEMLNVYTVMDFLNMYSSNRQALREIYGSSAKNWETTVNHAKTSIVDNKGNALERSNTMPFFEDGGNLELDEDCYFPQHFDNGFLYENMIVDPFFSIGDLEECDMCIQGSIPCQASREDEFFGATTMISHGKEGISVKAKKRWVKMRTLLFSIVNFMCVCDPVD